MEIRAGQGWSITTPSVRSMYVAIPSHRFDEITTPLFLYVNKSITMFERSRNLEFILGVTPTILVELAREFPRVSVEGGIGLNVLSTRRIGGRNLGSNILFSPTLGASIEVPWLDNVVGISYLFRHLSNAGFVETNDGVNFQYIVFSMSFRGF